MSRAAPDVVASIWGDAGLDPVALRAAQLPGREPGLRSSFPVSTAAQAALGVAALAATEIGRLRNGLEQSVRVDLVEAAVECTGRFTLDGVAPEVWDPIAGLYRCGAAESGAWVRLHTNFAHHRDGLLRLLGLPEGPGTAPEQVARALLGWQADELETRATERGLVVARLRSFDEWDRHPQAAAVAALPLIEIERIGDAPPIAWPELAADARPLDGLRVLDLTRILAGPVAGRTLAAFGADVMLVTRPRCRTSRPSRQPAAASARRWRPAQRRRPGRVRGCPDPYERDAPGLPSRRDRGPRLRS